MAAIKSVETDFTTLSNVVSKEELRKVQRWTLHALKDAVSPSAGPYGSTTQILKIDPNSIGTGGGVSMTTEYSKDGHTIMSHVKFNKAIEDSLQREFTDVTRHIVKKVGDGTTSVIILASYIFDYLLTLDDKYAPYQIIEVFQYIVDEIKEIIKSNARDLTLDDVYDISMICTNSNKRVSNVLSNIYKEYGKDVFIDVGASTGDEDVIKTYDGLTLDVGFSDSCYVNRTETGNRFNQAKEKNIEQVHGECVIRNPKIYAFTDPIDTREMQSMFDTIVYNNIMKPYGEYQKTHNIDALDKLVPTVIMAPKISLDMSSTFDNIVAFMHQFNQNLDMKPPLLIVTNIAEINYETYSDIWMLCGAKPIKKYIDPEIQKKDQEDGKAPTPETICDFCGHADEVKSDALKTSFINPSEMFEKDKNGEFVKDEDGNRVYAKAYQAQIGFLEQELQRSINEGADADVTGNLRRRIHALKANMVDYYVGGVTVTDRDSVRALVEDSVKNIRSASNYGVGFGANFEGLRASKEIAEKYRDVDGLKKDISECIFNAYHDISKFLYSTKGGYTDEELDTVVKNTIKVGSPMNLKNGKCDESVLCTIEQDMVILDTIAKIVTIIFTTNQALTQTVQHNLYMNLDKVN